MRLTDETGTDSETVFGTISEAETFSKGQQIKRSIENWLITPFKIIWADWRGRVGFLILLGYLFMGTVGVWMTSIPQTNEGPVRLLPFVDLNHVLGTNGLGQDLLRMVIHATPAMFKMVFAGAVFATVVAALIGVTAGYKGGIIDRILMTVTDMVVTLPGLMLVIVLAAIFEPQSPFIVGILLASHRWAGFSRSLRAQTLTLREESYVEGSRVLDLSTPSIIAKDILPNLMPLIAIYFMNTSRGIIFSSVGLYFLGILPISTSNWGVIMNRAYNNGALYSMDLVHWLLVPMLTIVLFSLGLILIAQGMDKLFNPRIRAKHES